MLMFKKKSDNFTVNLKSKVVRVVIIGKNGFIGSAVIRALNRIDIPTINIGRKEVDLTSKSSSKYFASKIKSNDIVFFAAGDVPVKNVEQFNANLTGLDNFINGTNGLKLSQLIYLSSDAVYRDSIEPLNEYSIRGPENLHGLMHFTREIMLQNSVHGDHLAILRPTLVYGPNDPHNSYGPCSFQRLAKGGNNIVLFGEGEEKRDFIFISDVADIVAKVILNQFTGELNIATGKVHTFFEIAKIISQMGGSKSKIISTPRVGGMPHNGYRPFSINKLEAFYPDLLSTSIYNGIKEMFEKEI